MTVCELTLSLYSITTAGAVQHLFTHAESIISVMHYAYYFFFFKCKQIDLKDAACSSAGQSIWND